MPTFASPKCARFCNYTLFSNNKLPKIIKIDKKFVSAYLTGDKVTSAVIYGRKTVFSG